MSASRFRIFRVMTRQRLRHFPRESLIARLSSGEASIVIGGTRGRQGESYLDDAQRATQSKGDSRGAGGEPGADADWTRSRTWTDHGRGCGRGLDKATTSRPGYGADIPRPIRDYFADAESFAGEGVRLVCVKSLRLKAANGGKCAVAKGDKLRQVCCRLLPQFNTGADAARFVGRMVKGMVSSENCPQIRARQTLEICLDGMSADVRLAHAALARRSGGGQKKVHRPDAVCY